MNLRILLLTNLFPTEATPSGGGFVLDRIDAFRGLGHVVDSFAVRPVRVGPARTIPQLLGRRQPSLPSGLGLEELPVQMGSASYVAAWRGQYPHRAIESAAVELAGRVENRVYDVVLAHGMYAVPAGSIAATFARRAQLPYVVVSHGSDVNYAMPKRRNDYSRVYDEACACIFVSEALRARAVAMGMTSIRTHVVPNGVDTDTFSPDLRRDGRAALEVPDGSPVILFVGNMLEVKGLSRLRAIFSEVSDHHPGALFVMAGDGPLLTTSQRDLSGLPVRWLGRIGPSRVAETMAAADVVIAPSHSEGWPTVVNEAYACGTPVVASDAGGLPEAVAYPERVIAGGTDFEGRFAKAVIKVLATRRDAEEFRSRAVKHSWELIVAREAEILQNCRERNN